jgi:hypothetical protein
MLADGRWLDHLKIAAAIDGWGNARLTAKQLEVLEVGLGRLWRSFQFIKGQERAAELRATRQAKLGRKKVAAKWDPGAAYKKTSKQLRRAYKHLMADDSALKRLDPGLGDHIDFRQKAMEADRFARMYDAMVKGFPKNHRSAKTHLIYGAIKLVWFIVGEDVAVAAFVQAVVEAFDAGEISAKAIGVYCDRMRQDREGKQARTTISV